MIVIASKVEWEAQADIDQRQEGVRLDIVDILFDLLSFQRST